MHLDYDRKLILKNGEEYYGFSFGDSSDRIVEIVFNTSMAGYQEILSDPSGALDSLLNITENILQQAG